MKIPKPSDADREYFRSLVPADPRVEIRPMFGNLGAFIGGNMFMGLFGAVVGVRLGDEHRAELMEQPGAGPYLSPERPMKGWAALPAAWRDEPARAAPWVGRALEQAAAMPPKAAKSRKAPPARG